MAAKSMQDRQTDVCLIVEGCYPYVPGGVSGWIDWLMRSQPATSFSVVTLWPQPTTQPPRYKLPPNAVALHHVYLQDFGAPPRKRMALPAGIDDLAHALADLMANGGIEPLGRADRLLDAMRGQVSVPVLFNSPIAWEIVRRLYDEEMPYGSFLHFFWAWRALMGGLFATLEFPLPRAKVYHTISTGYAGVLAARAALETGRPAVLTEHGIYTNERRIELLMADWVADTVDKGHAVDDPRLDLRDLWIRTFEAYARTCYEGCTEVVTLYEDNQKAQLTLGADPERLRVIANGIDLARFAAIDRAGDGVPPTMALIGRVVPIKDVKTFITAARILADRMPGLKALILGPTEEDADYHRECVALIADLRLGDTVEFTGTVDITAYMARIHVVVLTSLSESQPLVILEAGAAGIPFVATNVGSCREILEGRSDESPQLGSGGIVTDLVAPRQVADAVGSLLADPEMRRRYGDTLRERVKLYYRSEQAQSAYAALYERLAAAPTRRPGQEAA